MEDSAVKTAPQQKVHECQTCNRKFNSARKLKAHPFNTRHKPFLCARCPKEFSKASKLAHHLKDHEEADILVDVRLDENRNFVVVGHNKEASVPEPDLPEVAADDVIVVQEKSQIIADDIEVIVIDNGENDKMAEGPSASDVDAQFLCSMCDEGFRSKFLYIRHIRRQHTKERPYECTECHAEFVTSTQLKRHEMTHLDKQFNCPFCQKTLTFRRNLNAHVRVHSGEKPYICPFCDTEYAKKSSLTSHILFHLNERPYWCDNCGLADFRKKSHLTRHKKTGRCRNANAQL